MESRAKRIICIMLIVAVFILGGYYVVVKIQKQSYSTPEQIAMSRVDVDTNYIPLPDINEDQVVEHALENDYVVVNGEIHTKTEAYKVVESNYNESENTHIFTDGDDSILVVSQTEAVDHLSTIIISKYRKDGKKLLVKTFDEWSSATVYGARYHNEMGIVLSGIFEFTGDDFKEYNNTPSVACINAKTLELRWVYPINNGDSVFEVTGDAVYVICNKIKSASNLKDLGHEIVKLNQNGEQIWETKPLQQWIEGITRLQNGNVVVVQNVADEGNAQIICFDKNGRESLRMNADCYGEVLATDDGGFILVAIRNVKSVPQPVYISSIWFDTETVAVKYDNEFNVQWRKTYDDVKDAVGIDQVVACRDGSLVTLK